MILDANKNIVWSDTEKISKDKLQKTALYNTYREMLLLGTNLYPDKAAIIVGCTPTYNASTSSIDIAEGYAFFPDNIIAYTPATSVAVPAGQTTGDYVWNVLNASYITTAAQNTINIRNSATGVVTPFTMDTYTFSTLSFSFGGFQTQAQASLLSDATHVPIAGILYNNTALLDTADMRLPVLTSPPKILVNMGIKYNASADPTIEVVDVHVDWGSLTNEYNTRSIADRKNYVELVGSDLTTNTNVIYLLSTDTIATSPSKSLGAANFVFSLHNQNQFFAFGTEFSSGNIHNKYYQKEVLGYESNFVAYKLYYPNNFIGTIRHAEWTADTTTGALSCLETAYIQDNTTSSWDELWKLEFLGY